MKKIELLLPVSIFILLLSGFIVHFIMPDKSISQIENRSLQRVPLHPTKIDILSGEWSQQMEEYFADQFPGREHWMKNYVKSELLLGKTYIKEKYYYDEETGWITTKPAPLQPSEKLEQLARQVGKINSWMEDESIPFAFYHLPAKATYIRTPHPSFMPPDKGKQNSEDLLEYLRQQNVTADALINYIPPPHDIENWYFKTDHHWNIDGAFKAYEALMFVIGRQIGTDIIPYQQEDLIKTCLPTPLAGSWNKFYQMIIPTDDRICYLTPKEKDDFSIVISHNEEQQSVVFEDIYGNTQNLKQPGYINYAEGYSSDYGQVTITNEQGELDLHLVIFKDSYLNPIQFHIAHHFKKTTIIDLRHFEHSLQDWIKEESIDLALMLSNDRNFTLGLQGIFEK